jgi:S-adenosylmethionine hydrolase
VFVGPDNGLLAPAVGMEGGASRAVSLTNADYQLAAPGPTFAGRDVFGPAAAHLCNGVDLLDLGDPIDPHSLQPGLLPLTRHEDEAIVAEVLWIDRFGNAQLNVDPDEVAAMGDVVTVQVGEQVRTGVRASTFADLSAGQVGLVVDSYGLLALALHRRSAATELHLHAGDAVSLRAAT